MTLNVEPENWLINKNRGFNQNLSNLTTSDDKCLKNDQRNFKASQFDQFIDKEVLKYIQAKKIYKEVLNGF